MMIRLKPFPGGKIFVILSLFLSSFIALFAQESAPDAEEILRRVDANVLSETRVFTSSMTIHGRRSQRTISSQSWVEGAEKSFTEYLAPAREKGIKMLKLEDQLWTFSPSTDRTIRISGHMLRQSVMGSDLSYEDFMEDRSLLENYNVVVTGEEDYEGRPCWILELTAREKEVAYYSRKIWVDKERYLGLQEERYARSGKLLKTTRVLEMMKVGDRWVVKHVVFRDMLKKSEGTEFVIDAVSFSEKIPPSLFSKASLRR